MMQRLAELLNSLMPEAHLTADELTWGILFGGLIMAMAHLITMLITRWGDRAATTKSLIFSVLAHMTCALGLVTVNPPAQAVPRPPPERDPMQVKELLVGQETQQTEDPGNTPVWEQPPQPTEEQLARLDREIVELMPLESPDRQPEELTRPEVDQLDLPSLPNEPVATPRVESAGEQQLQVDSAVPVELAAPPNEVEIAIPLPQRPRRVLEKRGRVQAEPIGRAPAGAVDRIDKQIDTSQELASIDAPQTPQATLKRGPEADNIQTRAGPEPSFLPLEESGETSVNEPSGSERDSSSAQRLARTSRRATEDRAVGSIERLRPENIPGSQQSQTEREVAVRDTLPVDIPLPGLQPNVVRPNFEGLKSTNQTNVPSTYRLRSLARREEVARQYGGTNESERAVEASLEWLAASQAADGYWDAERYGAGQVKIDEAGVDRLNAGINADSGLTGLAILAFLGAGYTQEEGPYAENIDRALRWLIAQQDADGFLGGNATRYARMYCHAMATYGLAEAYGMQSDPATDRRLRQPLVRAIAYIVDNQHPGDGGWRYLKGQESDMSMFGWQVMALKSARIAGIRLPDDVMPRTVRFLKDRSLGNRQGLAGYRPGMPPTPSMTAEALFAKQMLGIERTNAACVEAVDYLLKNLPRRSKYDLYYWYYGTLAMYQYGGESWQKWNESLRDRLIADQVQSGANAGSWDPKDRWGPYGGRVYSTVLSTLCLEVYYRFLPLYNMGGQYDEP